MSTRASKRLRSRRACDSCRRRKRKCDGNLPCQACVDFEYACSFTRDSETPETPEHAVQVSTNAERLHSMASSLRENVDPSTADARTSKLLSSGRRESDNGIIEPWKLRFMDASSAIAFPKMVSLLLSSDTHPRDEPRLHSYAYNIGLRQERLHTEGPRLADILTLEEGTQYSAVFFQSVNTYYAIIELDTWEADLRKCWSVVDDPHGLLSELVVCFVVALGSLFSWPHQLHCEAEVVLLGESLLNHSTFQDAPSLIQLHHARAWILRTLYLRSMTRPNIAWLSSSMTMHVVESMGLHREMSTLRSTVSPGPINSPHDLNIRRKLFWVAWSVNHMISFEYGRSHVTIMGVSTKHPSEYGFQSGLALLNLYSLLYEDSGNILIVDSDKHIGIIQKLDIEDGSDSFCLLAKADIACGLHRKLCSAGKVVDEKHARHLLSIGRRALEAVRKFLAVGQPWWTCASIPFQLACTIIALGSNESLEMLSECLHVLQEVKNIFGTHLTREAYETAEVLTKIATQAKEGQLKALQSALLLRAPAQQLETPLDYNFSEWTTFLNQDLIDS